MSKEVLNVEEVAEFLGFHAATIREKAAKGEIPGRKIGREWRFSRHELLAFIQADSTSERQGEARRLKAWKERGGVL